MPNPAPRYWIKLHRAILAIGCGVRPYAQPPQFVAAEFYESLKALSPTLVAKAREWRPGANDLEFALFFENAKFEIALGGGEFSFDTFDPAQGLAARAYCFAEEFSSLDFVGVDDEFRTEILNLSAAICDSATDEFNEALWSDEWKLMARTRNTIS